MMAASPASIRHGAQEELGAVLAGAAIGVLTCAFMKVSVDSSGQKWTDAGVPYAAIWIVLAGARSALVYGCTHWFSYSLGMFLINNHIGVNAFGGAIMFLSLVPIVVNRLMIMARGGGASMVPAARHAGASAGWRARAIHNDRVLSLWIA
jgi:hypothetical protein